MGQAWLLGGAIKNSIALAERLDAPVCVVGINTMMRFRARTPCMRDH